MSPKITPTSRTHLAPAVCTYFFFSLLLFLCYVERVRAASDKARAAIQQQDKGDDSGDSEDEYVPDVVGPSELSEPDGDVHGLDKEDLDAPTVDGVVRSSLSLQNDLDEVRRKVDRYSSRLQLHGAQDVEAAASAVSECYR